MKHRRSWEANVEIGPEFVDVLVTEGVHDVLSAKFFGDPIHPRALLFLLEGLALWSGQTLSVVIYAASPVHPRLGLGDEGDDWPRDTHLLHFLFSERPSDGRRRCRRGPQ